MQKDLMSEMGPNVDMSTEKMENDPWAAKMLKEIGDILTKKQQANGMKYLGSYAFHIFASKDLGVSGKLSMGSITQVALDDDCSERLALLAFNNGVLEMRRQWNPNAKSGRRGDKR